MQHKPRGFLENVRTISLTTVSRGAHLPIAKALPTTTTTSNDVNWQTDRETGLYGHKQSSRQTSHQSVNETDSGNISAVSRQCILLVAAAAAAAGLSATGVHFAIVQLPVT